MCGVWGLFMGWGGWLYVLLYWQNFYFVFTLKFCLFILFLFLTFVFYVIQCIARRAQEQGASHNRKQKGLYHETEYFIYQRATYCSKGRVVNRLLLFCYWLFYGGLLWLPRRDLLFYAARGKFWRAVGMLWGACYHLGQIDTRPIYRIVILLHKYAGAWIRARFSLNKYNNNIKRARLYYYSRAIINKYTTYKHAIIMIQAFIV